MGVTGSSEKGWGNTSGGGGKAAAGAGGQARSSTTEEGVEGMVGGAEAVKEPQGSRGGPQLSHDGCSAQNRP